MSRPPVLCRGLLLFAHLFTKGLIVRMLAGNLFNFPNGILANAVYTLKLMCCVKLAFVIKWRQQIRSGGWTDPINDEFCQEGESEKWT
jgi:hypothetical protein